MKALPENIQSKIKLLCAARNVTLLRVRNPQTMGDRAALNGIIVTVIRAHQNTVVPSQLSEFLEQEPAYIHRVIKIMRSQEFQMNEEPRIRTMKYEPRDHYGNRNGAKARS